MGSKCNRSPLFSTYTSSKLRRNYSKNTNTGTTRYIVGSVGKSGGSKRFSTLEIDSDSSNSSKSASNLCPNRHKNVAIATQVLNPSAICSSKKDRKFVEHFGPKDDTDDDSFFNHKYTEICWENLWWYAVSIAVAIMIITGTIVVIGFLQSDDNQNISDQQALAQGQHFTTTQRPASILHGTTTTQKSTTLAMTDVRQEEGDDDDIDEIGIDNYGEDEDLQNLESHNDIKYFPSDLPEFQSHSDDENDISNDYSEHHDDDKKHNKDNLKDDPDEERETEVTENHDEEEEDVDLDHKSFSEVRVLPPPNYPFEGITFGIPIYRTNHSQTFNNKLNATYSEENNNKDESHSESGENVDSSDSSTKSFVIKQKQIENKGTKDETISHSISTSNFTSLINSQEEEEGNKRKTKYEEIPLSHENYTNASDESPSEESFSDSLYYATKTDTNSKKPSSNNENLINYTFHSLEDTITDNSNDKYNGIIDTKADGGEFTTLNVNKGDFKTAPIATLQTDIFDNDDKEDFETSASEENGIDVRRNDNRDRPRIRQQNKPRDPLGHINTSKNGQNSQRSKGPHNNRPKGQKRPSSPYSSDYVDEEHFRSDLKKLSLRPHPQRKRVKEKRPYKTRIDDNFDTSTDSDRDLDPTSDKNRLDLNLLQLKPSSGNFQGTSITMPILEYKADFNKIIPPSPEKSTGVDSNFQYQSPPPSQNTGSPYPDFKFHQEQNDESYKPFNLKEYLDKHAHKNSNVDLSPVSTSKSNSKADNTGSLVEQFSINQPLRNEFANIGIQTSATNPTLSTGGQFGLTFPNQGDNQLSTQPGGYGSPTASSNLYQPQNFNFDTSSGNNPFGLNIDLATQANLNNRKHGFTVDANGAFSLINPSSLPYPNIIGASDNLGANNFQNAYSFTNSDTSGSNSANTFSTGGSKDLGILTTGSGQVPTYNTITQGIHLLSLLSGKTPQGYQDQYQSGSNNDFTFSTNQPDLQTATGYGGSSNQFLQSLGNRWKFPIDNENSATFQSYAQDFFPRKHFRAFDGSGDQESSGSSFSKHIVLKASDLDKSLKAITTSINSNASSESKTNQRNNGNEKQDNGKISKITQQSLLQRLSSKIASRKQAQLETTSSSSSELEPTASKSRKRPMQLHEKEASESEMDSSPKLRSIEEVSPSSAANTEANKEGTKMNGLKSGFFT